MQQRKDSACEEQQPKQHRQNKQQHTSEPACRLLEESAHMRRTLAASLPPLRVSLLPQGDAGVLSS
jgi:hypothetical protein